MLSLLRTNTPFSITALFILLVLLKVQVIISPAAPTLATDGMLVYGAVVKLFKSILGASNTTFTLITILMLFGQGLYLSAIANRHKLFYHNGQLPAFVFICFTSLYPGFNAFGPPLLVCWCMLLALDALLGIPRMQKVKGQLFNAGFFIGLAALLQFSAILFVGFLLVSILMLRTANFSEILIAILGCILPAYFTVGLLFLFDGLPLIVRGQLFGMALPRHVLKPLHTITTVMAVFLYTALGLFNLQGIVGRLAISTRRSWSIVLLYGFAALLVALFTPHSTTSAWLVSLPALSLIAAAVFQKEGNKRFANFMVFFLVVIVLFCQFAITW